MTSEKYYQHSGQAPLLGIIIAIGLGAAIAIILGFIYNFLIVTIPMVYINFLLTSGFGLVVGYSMKFISRFSKIRNSKQSILIAGITGFIGWYFQWIAYLVFLNSGEHSIEGYQNNFDLFYNPLLFFNILTQLSEIGSWSMFGITFKDFPLWIIWGIEAGLIIGIPILIATKHPIIPYSESLNKWYRKYILKYQFETIVLQNKFSEDLDLNITETINNLNYGDPFRYSEISIYYLENEDKQYLCVENLFLENGGSGKTNRTPIVHLLQIDTITAQTLMEKFKTKKPFILDY